MSENTVDFNSVFFFFFFSFLNSARTILAPENAKIVHSNGGYSGFSIFLALFIDENSLQ